MALRGSKTGVMLPAKLVCVQHPRTSSPGKAGPFPRGRTPPHRALSGPEKGFVAFSRGNQKRRQRARSSSTAAGPPASRPRRRQQCHRHRRRHEQLRSPPPPPAADRSRRQQLSDILLAAVSAATAIARRSAWRLARRLATLCEAADRPLIRIRAESKGPALVRSMQLVSTSDCRWWMPASRGIRCMVLALSPCSCLATG